MNSVFGVPSWDTLPFDMRHLRHPLTYSLAEGASSEDRSKIKNELSGKLAAAIELIIKENIIEKSATKPSVYEGTPSTTKLSTFLESNETFLDASSRFSIVETKVYLPDTQHYFLRLIPSIPLTNIKTSPTFAIRH
jgi:hypothetical protein